MDDIAVVNASPLIFFSRSGHWVLLTTIARRLVVPQAVADEILERGENDPTARQLQNDGRIEIIQAGQIPTAVEIWGLGPGESAVIHLTRTIPGAVAVIDDLAGRKCAAAFGLFLRGTLGIVLLAKQRGVISTARPVIDDLLKSGMYLSRSVLDTALARVGE
jgi:predicted nucleic acid-binding protein